MIPSTGRRIFSKRRCSDLLQLFFRWLVRRFCRLIVVRLEIFLLLRGEEPWSWYVFIWAVRRRLIYPLVQIQPATIDSVVVKPKIAFGKTLMQQTNNIPIFKKLGTNCNLYPSGTGTFFCAFGATGLSSPANKADTSSETDVPFSWSFWMYLISWRMQHAWCEKHKNIKNTQVRVLPPARQKYIWRFERTLSCTSKSALCTNMGSFSTSSWPASLMVSSSLSNSALTNRLEYSLMMFCTKMLWMCPGNVVTFGFSRASSELRGSGKCLQEKSRLLIPLHSYSYRSKHIRLADALHLTGENVPRLSR